MKKVVQKFGNVNFFSYIRVSSMEGGMSKIIEYILRHVPTESVNFCFGLLIIVNSNSGILPVSIIFYIFEVHFVQLT